jgi:hypothetical protein
VKVIKFKDNQLDSNIFNLNIERTVYIDNNTKLEKLLCDKSLDLKRNDIQIKTINISENNILNEPYGMYKISLS